MGTASYLTKFPVVSCPPDGMNNTCLTNPPGSSNAYVMKPANVAKFAAQMFAPYGEAVDNALNANIAEKITKLENADQKLDKRSTSSKVNDQDGDDFFGIASLFRAARQVVAAAKSELS